MCILFMYVANCAKNATKTSCSATPTTYKLILATNRDESFARPAKPANFWEGSDAHILAGQDLQELGTWLGLSKHGKLAILLSVMSGGHANPNPKPTSRGSLPTGFLRSPPGLPGWTYCSNLCQDAGSFDIATEYNPFHLITIDFRGKHISNNTTREEDDDDLSTIRVTHLTNRSKSCCNTSAEEGNVGYSCKVENITPQMNNCELYGFGNSPVEIPFRKVTCGREQFSQIVEKYCGKEACESRENALTAELLELLKSKEEFFPDPILEEFGKAGRIPQDKLPHLSSPFMNVPGFNYGTRTHTVILVDTDNNVTFHEYTLREPIVSNSTPDWIESKYKLTLTPPN